MDLSPRSCSCDDARPERLVPDALHTKSRHRGFLIRRLAGLIYAFAFLRRGRIGDAVIAHATTNAFLAGWVLAGGRWYLW